MNNHQGFSFVETILTVSILFLLFGTLLPMTNQMMFNLAEKKVALHVAIAKNQAATLIKNGQMSGEIFLDNVSFSWQWTDPTMCVRYVFFEESKESCETF